MTDPSEIQRLFHICHSAAGVNYEGVTDAESLQTPDSGGSHMNWILGHIVASRDVILDLLGEPRLLTPEQAEPYKRGAELGDVGKLMSFKETVGYYDRGQSLLKRILAELTPEQLEAVDPDKNRNSNQAPLYSSLLFLHFHEAYHVGQLGILRRIIGKEGAIQ